MPGPAPPRHTPAPVFATSWPEVKRVGNNPRWPSKRVKAGCLVWNSHSLSFACPLSPHLLSSENNSHFQVLFANDLRVKESEEWSHVVCFNKETSHRLARFCLFLPAAVVFALNTYKFKLRFKIINLGKKRRSSTQAKYFFILDTEFY